MAVPRVLDPPVHAEAERRDHATPASDPPRPEPMLPPGTRVEVRKRLDGEWAHGFEVLTADADGYRLRRLSDGGELPLLFGDEDVRKERKRGTWWY